MSDLVNTDVNEWCEGPVSPPETRPIHYLFSETAAERRDAIAVVDKAGAYRYADLEARSNQVAHQLREFGIGPEMLVGVAMERCFDMVVVLLAILKVGGAYLPLDPAYPIDRLAFMLGDSGANLVVTQKHLADRVPTGARQMWEVDSAPGNIDALSNEPVGDTSANGFTLAYCIYTSGSTGKPKGVLVEQSALANLLTDLAERLEVTNNITMLGLSSLSFDIATVEIFLPLVFGGRLVLVDHATARDPARLVETIVDHRVTHVQATPTTWRTLTAAGPRPEFSEVTAIAGGETLAADLAEALVRDCYAVHNLYGPTETTVYATGHRLTKPERHPPIGRPVLNMQAFILDEALQPVPPGVTGELYVGGAGLARGYLNRPMLTEERFAELEVFGIVRRLYRTGDIARWRSDGEIEHLGRSDQQIKIRGYRIEPAEVEAQLLAHSAVSQAAVVGSEHGGQPLLIGYVTLTMHADEKELRAFLAVTLPDYMVPGRIVEVAQMPLTPSGKLDLKALPAPTWNAVSPEPATADEEVMLRIWRDMLDYPEIGPNDEFFDVGGDSLGAMRVVAASHAIGWTSLTVGEIFAAQTVRALCRNRQAD